MTINVGDKAPSFTLRASDTQPITLEDHQGKNVVLLFFPLAFTSVCTAELCSVSSGLDEYSNLNADVLGISVDSPFTLAKFKETEQISFPLLSDFNKEVSRAYGALYEDFVLDLKGVSKRSAFVIDADGIVKYAEVLDDAGQQPNFAGILEALKRLS
ncbi:MAG: redoxin domain-containing protein [Bacteroidota bacterium]